MTHGSWTAFPNPRVVNNNAPYTRKEFEKNIRKCAWRGSHLRTFKYKVWKHIKDEDLKDDKGRYYRTAWDCAFMWPMIEMAGINRVQFIPDILYVYNQETPFGDAHVHLREQMFYTDYIAAKPPYSYRENF